MGRLLTLLALLGVALYGYSYNPQLLQVYAKIAPRIVLLTDRPGSLATVQQTIDICIVYEPGDQATARELRAAILETYPDGLNDIPLNILLTPYSGISERTNAVLLFLLDTDETTMKRTLAFALEHHIPTMSYSNRYLALGVAASLHLGKSVRTYLNLNAAKRYGITFDPLLLQVSKLYSEEAGE